MNIKVKQVLLPSMKILSLVSILLVGIDTVSAQNLPQLRCEVTYAGTSHQVITQLSDNPYLAEVHDIAGRFSFKAVMIGDRHKSKIRYIKLYAYLQGRDFDIPVHQATYNPPFHVSTKIRALTPINHLYAGDVERELQYQCFLGRDEK